MDHLSSNILMCAMLLLFYASGTVEGAAYGASCSADSDCTGDGNQRCDTTCKCKTTAITNTASNGCILKIALEATCLDGEPAEQCIDGLAECRNDDGFKCLCKAANYKGSSGCEVRKAPGATCTSGACVTNAVCSTTCTCNTGYTATPTTNPSSCESSDATIIIAHLYVFMFGIVASLYFLV